MLVLPADDRLKLVTQADHARLAAELLALWSGAELRHHPLRSDILEATRHHDDGWWEADAAPQIGPDRRPLDFRSLPETERIPIWQRGIERARSHGPVVGLLVSEHALRLHADRLESPQWKPASAEWREIQDELLEATGLAADEIFAAYAWLALADRLSLAVLHGWTEPIEACGVRAAAASVGELHLDPFPYAGALSLRAPARTVPDRGWSAATELTAELATARWQEISIHVRPAGSTASAT